MGFVSASFWGRSRISVWVGRFAEWLLVGSLGMVMLSSWEEVALSFGESLALRAVLTNR